MYWTPTANDLSSVGTVLQRRQKQHVHSEDENVDDDEDRFRVCCFFCLFFSIVATCALRLVLWESGLQMC